MFSIIRQSRGHLARHADQRCPRLIPVVLVIGRVVIQHDEVDVRAVIQLSRAHFAHRHRKHTGGVSIRRWQLAAINLSAQMRAQREVGGAIGKIRQSASDLLQRPYAAKIGNRGDQGDPTLCLSQRGAQILGIKRGCIGQNLRYNVITRRLQLRGQPIRFFLHQRP